jgi:hypothetical protein
MACELTDGREARPQPKPGSAGESTGRAGRERLGLLDVVEVLGRSTADGRRSGCPILAASKPTA